MSFLAAHRCNPRTWSLGGSLYPVSLRDQTVRASGVIEEAFQDQLIVPHDRLPLLVVGAGMAGVAAAISAARRDVRTVLIDRENDALILQAGCSTRWISPTLYDWPAAHWGYHCHPLGLSAGVPPNQHLFYWQGNYADAVAWTWRGKLANELARASHLEFWRHTTLVTEPQPVPNGDYVEVELSNGERQSTFLARAVVLAWGFGGEQVSLNAAHLSRGVRFWDTDRLAQPNAGLAQHVSPNVVISGSGDGGLQDFIRICTEENNLPHVLDQSLSNDALAHLEANLRPLHERAQRAHSWGRNALSDHEHLDALHRKYDDEVSRLLNGGAAGSEIYRRVRKLIKFKGKIRIVYPCSHFANCYGINRILALLFSRVLEQERHQKVLIAGKRLHDVWGTYGHNCCGEADRSMSACYGASHEVTVCEHVDCRQPAAAENTEKWSNVNVLVMRHGVTPTPQLRRLSPQLPRQLLPYDLPY